LLKKLKALRLALVDHASKQAAQNKEGLEGKRMRVFGTHVRNYNYLGNGE